MNLNVFGDIILHWFSKLPKDSIIGNFNNEICNQKPPINFSDFKILIIFSSFSDRYLLWKIEILMVVFIGNFCNQAIVGKYSISNFHLNSKHFRIIFVERKIIEKLTNIFTAIFIIIFKFIFNFFLIAFTYSTETYCYHFQEHQEFHQKTEAEKKEKNY